ncbi:reverse transcriptase [Tanacetum coccineum]|uniref:Reverse transcriptase n=1 Tax=Tanacetum coccineum TaxID=301880 RepID=A0ABQ4ZZL5_9ASTR
MFLGYSQTSKAYIVLNKETMKIEESLNVAFDERFPEPNSSPSVEDDRINKPIVQDLNGSPSLQLSIFPTMMNAPPKNCLLGKVIANNHIVHKQSVVSNLSNAWRNLNSVTISPWKNNFFNFAFKNKDDIEKILHDSPWSAMGFYVAIVPWDSNKTLNELEFYRGEFWIQVHDLPLGMLSSEYTTELAKSMGGTESLVSLKYEYLSDFCYRCGRLGHGRDSCTNEVIAKAAGLIDIPYTGLKYTWSNQWNEGDNIRERIDRALGNINLLEACPFQSLLYKPLIGSDHAPLIYSSHPTHQRKRSSFHFKSLWTTHEECENTIQSSWPTLVAGNQLLGIKHNLSKCASRLKKWSGVTFGNNKRNISDLTREIKMVQNLPYTPKNFHSQRMLLKELESTWLRAEMYWHQQSRVNWLNYGDHNSCFFHLYAIQRGQKNIISGLKNSQGEWDVINVLDPVVFETMNIHLQSPITDSEIHKTTKQFGGLKAPGEDGFPGMFYQKY